MCAFIPKGSEHSVKAGPTSSLTCLSINEGIIKPGSGADIHFVRQHPASTANTWGKFIKDCTKTAAVFQKQIRDEGQKWNVFSVRL